MNNIPVSQIFKQLSKKLHTSGKEVCSVLSISLAANLQ